jgi:hypothetical protein
VSAQVVEALAHPAVEGTWSGAPARRRHTNRHGAEAQASRRIGRDAVAGLATFVRHRDAAALVVSTALV